MSRIGKAPVVIPPLTTVDLNGLQVSVCGPKGNLERMFVGNVSFEIRDSQIFVTCNSTNKLDLSMWGTTRSLLNNMIIGVNQGFEKELEIFGTGYKAEVSTRYLSLFLGKSHGIRVEIPGNLVVQTPKPTIVKLFSIDKESLGLFAAQIIKQRPVEPYKGKGIRYKGRIFERKR